jgi:hypothetical protein
VSKLCRGAAEQMARMCVGVRLHGCMEAHTNTQSCMHAHALQRTRNANAMQCAHNPPHRATHPRQQV